MQMGTASSSRKRDIKGEFPKLEECLMQWVVRCRQQNVPINGPLLKEKAKDFAAELKIPSFGASDGWVNKFKKRNGLVFLKMCGESAAVDDDVCSS